MIVDAGGAFGSFSLYALRTAARARVIGIEPFPASYQRMCDVVARNDLSGRFSPVQATLGAAEDVSFMASGDQPSQFRRITGEQDGGLAVATKSLEQVFDEHGIEQVASRDDGDGYGMAWFKRG